MQTNDLRREMEKCKIHVEKLSNSINNESNLWRDNKVSELKQSISQLANDVNSLASISSQVLREFNKFYEISDKE